MANLNRPLGFKPENIVNASPHEYPVTAAQVTQEGDVLYMSSAGTVGGVNTDLVIGIQAGNYFAKAGNQGKLVARDPGDAAVAGDKVLVWDDPHMVFIGQISTFTITDPYTTRATAACYDTAGSAGAQYINAAASTLDHWKIKGLSNETTGFRSVAGAYAKVRAVFNLDKHIYGNA